jgi:hypothetical protein
MTTAPYREGDSFDPLFEITCTKAIRLSERLGLLRQTVGKIDNVRIAEFIMPLTERPAAS